MAPAIADGKCRDLTPSFETPPQCLQLNYFVDLFRSFGITNNGILELVVSVSAFECVDMPASNDCIFDVVFGGRNLMETVII